MSQTKVHKLSVRNRPGAEGRISVGANVQVMLDDKPLRGVSFLKIELKPAKLAKIQIELYAEVDAELLAELKESPPKPTNFRPAGKTDKILAKYDLSNIEPTGLVEKVR